MLNPNYNVRYDVFKPTDRKSDFWYGYIYDVSIRKQKKWNLNVTSKREAIKLVKGRIEEIYGNGDSIVDHMRYHRELNVSTVLDRYMKEHYIPDRGTKKTPEKNNRNISSQWSRIKNLKSILGNLPAKSLRKEDLNDYISKRQQVVIKATILREIRVLTAALNKVLPANTAALVSANIKGHEKLKGYPRPAYIKDEHYQKILKELNEVAPYMVPIIKIIHWCGARSDEIRGLMWHEIDWVEGRINLPPERTKEGRSKSMILNEECLTELLTIKENCDKTKKGNPLSKYVFHGPINKNAKLNERQYYLKWYEVCENLGFLDFSKIKKDGKPRALYLPHDFRHTRVVDNENAKIPRGLTKMQTGHKNDMMLEYYDTKARWYS